MVCRSSSKTYFYAYQVSACNGTRSRGMDVRRDLHDDVSNIQNRQQRRELCTMKVEIFLESAQARGSVFLFFVLSKRV
jgi:hypothetical protein